MQKNIKLINFIDILYKEKKMILAWRNHQNIKQWMINQDEITLEEHLKYIDSLSIKKDRIYFLVKELDNYLGVIDFTNIVKNECAEFGIYTKPNLIGIGSILMNSIINYAFDILKLKRLVANVYVNNEKAIKLYKKFNFIELTKDKDNNGKFVQMALKNENR